ncbi:MAG: HAMP domain-containing sensor histidine kinase [Woeseiaceae bacterium]|nr:HAMP domain-containing sensor histidine kinase [Woeseiaceae bacterium]
MLRRFSRSLSFRLFAIFLLLGGTFAYGAISAIRFVYNSDDIRGLISGHLSLHVYYVQKDIGDPPRIERALNITESVPVDIRILGPDIDWASDENFPRLSELQFGPSPAFSDDPGAWVDELNDVQFAATDLHNFLLLKSGEYDVVVSTPKISDTTRGPPLRLIIVSMGLAFLLLGYFAVSWLFKPIKRIREGASHIGRGNFDHRIKNIRSDQLGDLATDINQLAENVEHMLNAKRALLLGISHELKTPLSRMRIQTELIDNEEDQESMKAEVVEMDKIVMTLLEAERLSEGHAPLMRRPTRVGDLIESMVDDYFSRDTDRLLLDMREPDLVVDLDRPRMELCLKNLVSNALRYSPPDSGPVTISVRSSPYEVVFRIRDQGPGIPADQAEHIGEPFYRSDPSRDRQTGGTGLGLYLATLVARAHGGSLDLVDKREPGACFEVRIPLALDP